MGDYFCGWYFRCQSEEKTLAVIPAVHRAGAAFLLHKGDRPGGTGRETVAQPVAVIVPHQRGLTLHHGDGALVAGRGTERRSRCIFPCLFQQFCGAS